METLTSVHRPVLVEEVISSLCLRRGMTVVDATIGGGAHAREMAQRIGPEGRLIGIDADADALARSRHTLMPWQSQVTIVHDNFRNLDRILGREGIARADAILFDLGISSDQLEDAARGMSIKHDSRLDMRMDRRLLISAYEVVNTYAEHDLADIIWKWGEERASRRIARAIVRERQRNPVATTGALAEIVRRAIGYRHKKYGIDPATRTFQALRIAVNDELSAVEEGIKSAVSWLADGARIAIISFHSLEDRIAKHLLRSYAQAGVLNIITKKPVRPSTQESTENPRSRSARLRVAEKRAYDTNA